MGCLPMFLQIPVFLGLFHVLRHIRPDIDDKYKTLYGWTIGQFDSAADAKLFGAPIAASFRSNSSQLAALNANGTTVKIVAAVLIVLMICTTFLTSRQMILKTGWSEDPQQRMVQRLMLYGVPFSLLISGGLFPIGVVIYWVTQNVFSLGQQMWVLRKYPPPPSATKAGAGKKPDPKKPDQKKAAAKSETKRDKDGDTPKVIDGKALAPRVGAKPVNPKKRGAAPKR
jgi:YidC/Oxa1 family membrane protein insertase